MKQFISFLILLLSIFIQISCKSKHQILYVYPGTKTPEFKHWKDSLARLKPDILSFYFLYFPTIITYKPENDNDVITKIIGWSPDGDTCYYGYSNWNSTEMNSKPKQQTWLIKEDTKLKGLIAWQDSFNTIYQPILSKFPHYTIQNESGGPHGDTNSKTRINDTSSIRFIFPNAGIKDEYTPKGMKIPYTVVMIPKQLNGYFLKPTSSLIISYSNSLDTCYLEWN